LSRAERRFDKKFAKGYSGIRGGKIIPAKGCYRDYSGKRLEKKK